MIKSIFFYFSFFLCIYSQENWKNYFSESHFRDIEIDQSNNIWAAGLRGNEGIMGLVKYDGNEWTTYFYPPEVQYVNDIAIDNLNNIWIAHDGGVLSFNGEHWGSTKTDTLYEFQEIFASKLFADNNSNIWLSNGWYYLIFYGNNNKTVYDFKEILSAENCWIHGIDDDSQGNIYVFVRTKKSSSYHISYYIMKYINQNWEVVSFIDESIWGGLFTDFYGLHIDNQDNIWISTDGYLVKWNGTNYEKFETDIYTTPIDIESDSNGFIWFGTPNDGVIKFDGENYFHYNAETTNFPDKNVWEIIFDETEKLWVVINNSGILCLEDEDITTNVIFNGNLPLQYNLSQNYPNPFNPTTTIRYTIPKSENVQIKVYDILGREIKSLVNEYKQAGTHEVQFDHGNYSSGIYYYTIITESYRNTKKMILLR